MDERISFRNRAGESIAGMLGNPKKPNGMGVVLLHCFTCTKHHRIMRALSECLNAHGFSTLRFDFSGNGESEGKLEDATYTKMLGEVHGAVSFLKKSGAERIGVAGHSMGAMLALLSAGADRRIGAVAFISGSSQAARVREVFPKEALETAESEGASEAFVYGKTMRIRREFLLDVESYNVGHVAATMKTPLLIVHGTRDEVIPIFHARQLHSWAAGKKRLEWIEGADHLYRDETHLSRMRSTVCGWFAESL